jgi:hypothetical protein
MAKAANVVVVVGQKKPRPNLTATVTKEEWLHLFCSRDDWGNQRPLDPTEKCPHGMYSEEYCTGCVWWKGWQDAPVPHEHNKKRPHICLPKCKACAWVVSQRDPMPEMPYEPALTYDSHPPRGHRQTLDHKGRLVDLGSPLHARMPGPARTERKEGGRGDFWYTDQQLRRIGFFKPRRLVRTGIFLPDVRFSYQSIAREPDLKPEPPEFLRAWLNGQWTHRAQVAEVASCNVAPKNVAVFVACYPGAYYRSRVKPVQERRAELQQTWEKWSVKVYLDGKWIRRYAEDLRIRAENARLFQEYKGTITKLSPEGKVKGKARVKVQKLTIKMAMKLWDTSERTARRRLRELRSKPYQPVPDFLIPPSNTRLPEDELDSVSATDQAHADDTLCAVEPLR